MKGKLLLQNDAGLDDVRGQEETLRMQVVSKQQCDCTTGNYTIQNQLQGSYFFLFISSYEMQ